MKILLKSFHHNLHRTDKILLCLIILVSSSVSSLIHAQHIDEDIEENIFLEDEETEEDLDHSSHTAHTDSKKKTEHEHTKEKHPLDTITVGEDVFLSTSHSNVSDAKDLSLNGYILPQFIFRYRPSAKPRDLLEYGANETKAGIQFLGHLSAHWGYQIELIFSSNGSTTLSSTELIDSDGDKTPDTIATQSDFIPGLFIERAAIEFYPSQKLSISLGQLRIPFTVQAQSSTTNLLFPERSASTEAFITGTDLGLLLSLNSETGIFQSRIGIFNGTNAKPFAESNERGLLYNARMDINPLGLFPFSTTDVQRVGLRLGFGFGILYRPTQSYDETGFEQSQSRDLKGTVSFRLSYRGLSFQSEFLRRQKTFSLLHRPIIATGGYAQIAYYFPTPLIGFAPIARISNTVQDQSFDPRSIYWARGGLAFYLFPNSKNPEATKITLYYTYENRVTEKEIAHGGSLQIQMLW